MPSKKPRICVTLEVEDYAKLKTIADDQERPISNLALLILKEFINPKKSVIQSELVANYLKLLTGERTKASGIGFTEIEEKLGMPDGSLSNLYAFILECRSNERVDSTS